MEVVIFLIITDELLEVTFMSVKSFPSMVNVIASSINASVLVAFIFVTMGITETSVPQTVLFDKESRQVLPVGTGVLSHSELEERIYGWGDEVESNAIEFLIFSLRKKLGADAIKNVRGVGWLVSKQS